LIAQSDWDVVVTLGRKKISSTVLVLMLSLIREQSRVWCRKVASILVVFFYCTQYCCILLKGSLVVWVVYVGSIHNVRLLLGKKVRLFYFFHLIQFYFYLIRFTSCFLFIRENRLFFTGLRQNQTIGFCSISWLRWWLSNWVAVKKKLPTESNTTTQRPQESG